MTWASHHSSSLAGTYFPFKMAVCTSDRASASRHTEKLQVPPKSYVQVIRASWWALFNVCSMAVTLQRYLGPFGDFSNILTNVDFQKMWGFTRRHQSESGPVEVRVLQSLYWSESSSCSQQLPLTVGCGVWSCCFIYPIDHVNSTLDYHSRPRYWYNNRPVLTIRPALTNMFTVAVLTSDE